MAWISTRKRKKKGRLTPYHAIQWRDETGKIVTRALGFCSAREAKRALKVIEGKLAAGEALDPETKAKPGVLTPTAPGSSEPKVTLREWLRGTFLPKILRDRAKKTYDTMVNNASRVIEILGNVGIRDVNYAVVDLYISKRKKKGIRDRTIQLELKVIRQALVYAEKCEMIEKVPELPKHKVRDAKPHVYLTEEEAHAVLDELRPRENPGTRRCDRATYVAVLACLSLGTRSGEILSREWGDVDWEAGRHGTLHIGAKSAIDFRPKCRSDRELPLTRTLRRELLALGEEAGTDGWIFPGVNDRPRRNFLRALANACERAGVPVVHPHALRHSWASIHAQKGVPRNTLLYLGGWKSSEVLDEIYCHISPKHAAEMIDLHGIELSLDSGREKNR